MSSDSECKNEMPPAERLNEMIRGSDLTQLIYVAAKLGVADLLGDGPKSAEELAGAAGAHPRALYRVMRALASVGVFAMQEDHRFSLTPLAEPLRTDAPDSKRDWAMMWGEEWTWRAWGNLLHSVKTGETAFDDVAGMGLFQYLEGNREAAEVFNNVMTRGSEDIQDEVIGACDFSDTGTVVDVGGGHGALLAAILKAHPHMRGVLVDQPSVVEGAGGVVEAAGVSDRCKLIGGSFFDSVPAGGDVYILKWIIHDWDDEKASVILKNCRTAMSVGGRLLIVDRVVPPANEPFPGWRGDVTMMVLPGGLERTEAEFRALLESAGFRLSKVTSTRSELNVLEAKPL